MPRSRSEFVGGVTKRSKPKQRHVAKEPCQVRGSLGLACHRLARRVNEIPFRVKRLFFCAPSTRYSHGEKVAAVRRQGNDVFQRRYHVGVPTSDRGLFKSNFYRDRG